MTAPVKIFESISSAMDYIEREKELLHSSQSLELKRGFYRYISHEIRTPLSVAILGLNLIEGETGPSSYLRFAGGGSVQWVDGWGNFFDPHNKHTKKLIPQFLFAIL